MRAGVLIASWGWGPRLQKMVRGEAVGQVVSGGGGNGGGPESPWRVVWGKWPLMSAALGPAPLSLGLLRLAVTNRRRTWFVTSTMLAASVPKLFVCPETPARWVKC